MPTLNLVALPVVAGLMAGTGAVAAYVTGPTTAPIEVAKPADQPCAAQTWPYLDSKCLTRTQERRVRLVTAPRADDADTSIGASPSGAQQASVAPPDQVATPSGLTSSGAVLYQPDLVVPGKSKSRGKRAEERSRGVARNYRVPSEGRRGSGAMIVVRPLRLDQFR